MRWMIRTRCLFVDGNGGCEEGAEGEFFFNYQELYYKIASLRVEMYLLLFLIYYLTFTV